jgi:hypothetical protein
MLLVAWGLPTAVEFRPVLTSWVMSAKKRFTVTMPTITLRESRATGRAELAYAIDQRVMIAMVANAATPVRDTFEVLLTTALTSNLLVVFLFTSRNKTDDSMVKRQGVQRTSEV